MRSGRREKAIDPAAPYATLANAMRDLRRKKEISYRKMAELTNYGRTVLNEASDGEHLPTWEVLLAYVTACEPNLDKPQEREWWQRWIDARDQGNGTGS